MSASIKKREIFIPLFSLLFLILVVLYLWNKSINAQKSELVVQVKNTGELLTQKFNSIVRSDIQRLENLKDRLHTTDGEYFKYWEHDAKIILDQNPSFKFVEWIDSSMVIRKISPMEGNEAAIDLDISKIEYRRDEWLRHKIDSSTNVTPWAKLTQGGNAFLVDVPVYFKGHFQGTITAGMNFEQNLDEFASNLQDYGIEIKDEKGSVFYTHNSILKDSLNPDFIYTNSIVIDPLDNQNWNIKITPVSSNFLLDKSTIAFYMLFFGISLSTLMSIIIYFYLRVKREASRAIRANKKLKKTNKKLSKERNRAEKASKAKTEFLSNMSHEIRTPLNAILGFTQLLKSTKDTALTNRYIDLMDKSSKNLLSLVNDILEIDKIESGEIKLNNVVFIPSEELKAIVSQYETEFKAKNLFLNLNFLINYGTKVIGDEGKFNQIVINVLKNALKFTQDGGATISYEERLVDEKLIVIVKIEDTGIGIPKANLSKIFERFTQIDDGLKKKHEGSGLGLSISNTLVKLMGGSISVISEVDKGSEFVIEVPFKISDAEYEDNLLLNTKNINLEHLDVLIVDDNKVNILVLSKILEQLGIKSDKANNGQEAVEKVQEKTYQLILMDIHMPIMDGYEATRIIRSKNKDILICGLSANVTTQAIEKSLEIGMNDYLTKPLSKEKLYILLNKYF